MHCSMQYKEGPSMALKIESLGQTVLISSPPPYLLVLVPETSVFLLYPCLILQQGHNSISLTQQHKRTRHRKLNGRCSENCTVYSSHRKRLDNLKNAKIWPDQGQGEGFGGERILGIYTVYKENMALSHQSSLLNICLFGGGG